MVEDGSGSPSRNEGSPRVWTKRQAEVRRGTSPTGPTCPTPS